jgi:hypothetical protein
VLRLAWSPDQDERADYFLFRDKVAANAVACVQSVGAEPKLSHCADPRLSQSKRLLRQHVRGSCRCSPGSRRRRHKAAKWLKPRSAPTGYNTGGFPDSYLPTVISFSDPCRPMAANGIVKAMPPRTASSPKRLAQFDDFGFRSLEYGLALARRQRQAVPRGHVHRRNDLHGISCDVQCVDDAVGDMHHVD